MPASPSCSSRRSRPKKPASPPPKRRGWPNRSGRGSPPRARRRRSRPRPRPTPKPPSRRALRPRRPRRSRSSRRLPPSRSAPKLKSAADAGTKVAAVCAGGQIGDAESRRAERRRAAGRGHQVGADRTAPRRLPQRGRRRQLEHDVAAFADAVQPLRQHQARHQARLDRCARHDQAQDRRGSARWSASTATRPMATAAPRSSAPRARSSTTTMSARSGARRSRSPSATADQNAEAGARERRQFRRPAARPLPARRRSTVTAAQDACVGASGASWLTGMHVNARLPRLSRAIISRRAAPCESGSRVIGGSVQLCNNVNMGPATRGLITFRSRSRRCSPSARAARC